MLNARKHLSSILYMKHQFKRHRDHIAKITTTRLLLDMPCSFRSASIAVDVSAIAGFNA